MPGRVQRPLAEKAANGEGRGRAAEPEKQQPVYWALEMDRAPRPLAPLWRPNWKAPRAGRAHGERRAQRAQRLTRRRYANVVM